MNLPKRLYNIQHHNLSPSSYGDWCGTLTICPLLPTVKEAEDFHLYCLKLISPKQLTQLTPRLYKVAILY